MQDTKYIYVLIQGTKNEGIDNISIYGLKDWALKKYNELAKDVKPDGIDIIYVLEIDPYALGGTDLIYGNNTIVIETGNDSSKWVIMLKKVFFLGVAIWALSKVYKCNCKRNSCEQCAHAYIKN